MRKWCRTGNTRAALPLILAAAALLASCAGLPGQQTVSPDSTWFLRATPEGGTGSGSIIDPAGLVLTNLHLVKRAEKLYVTLHDGSSSPAQFAGGPLLNGRGEMIRIDTMFLSPARGSTAAPLDFALLAHLAEVYRSVRYEDASLARRDWQEYYRDLAVVDLPQTDNRYLVGTLPREDRQEIVIRGTANFLNAVYDAEVAKSQNHVLDTKLHSGFERMAMAVYHDLVPRLDASADLVIFGHSLGAAEAVILGMLLTHDGYRVSAIYASGQPKVTDAEGALRWKDLPVLRLSCEGDPIPLLPPRIVASREPFVHFGPEILLLDGPYYATVTGRTADEDTLSAVWRMLKTEKTMPAVRLHLFYPNYFGKLESKASGAIELPPGAHYQLLAMPPAEK